MQDYQAYISVITPILAVIGVFSIFVWPKIFKQYRTLQQQLRDKEAQLVEKDLQINQQKRVTDKILYGTHALVPSNHVDALHGHWSAGLTDHGIDTAKVRLMEDRVRSRLLGWDETSFASRAAEQAGADVVEPAIQRPAVPIMAERRRNTSRDGPVLDQPVLRPIQRTT